MDCKLCTGFYHGVKVKVTQSCLNLCNPMDCTVNLWNSPGHNTGMGSLSLLQGIFQPRDQTQVSRVAGSTLLFRKDTRKTENRKLIDFYDEHFFTFLHLSLKPHASKSYHQCKWQLLPTCHFLDLDELDQCHSHSCHFS